MEEPVVLSDATANVEAQGDLHLNACRWSAILGNVFGRFGCTSLLLIAAALKSYQLFTDPALGVLYGSRWLQTALVEYELLLAIWLLSGVALRWGRKIALLTFIGFGCYAFFLGILGKASCGCFGQAHVNPWWTFSIDAALAFLLIIWKPQRDKGTFESESGYVYFTVQVLLVITATFVVICIPLLLIAVWRPGSVSSIESSPENSRFILLDVENWIGKPFPLTEYIDIAEREHLSQGYWILVFYRHDCPKCQQVLPQYERVAGQLIGTNEETNIALIEIPPYGPDVLFTNHLCHKGRLSSSKAWLITTPTEVRMTDGRVTATTSALIAENTSSNIEGWQNTPPFSQRIKAKNFPFK